MALQLGGLFKQADWMSGCGTKLTIAAWAPSIGAAPAVNRLQTAIALLADAAELVLAPA